MNSLPLPAPRRPCVLIVEDEALVREIAALEFGDAGFEVLEAGDGPEAVALLESGSPIDLLFTDIRLPGPIDGWTIAVRARALRPGLPVIYATGFSADAATPVEGGQLFHKPYRPLAIIAAAKALGVTPDQP